MSARVGTFYSWNHYLGGDSDYGDVQLSLAAKMQWVTCAVHLSHASNNDESRVEGGHHGGSRVVLSLSKLFE